MAIKLNEWQPVVGGPTDTHPIAGGGWVQIEADIKHVASGEIRTYRTNAPWYPDDEDELSVFWWAEGNASCDCNRQLFFLYAAGVDTDDPRCDAVECGEGGYRVNLRNPKTGGVYYREFDA